MQLPFAQNSISYDSLSCAMFSSLPWLLGLPCLFTFMWKEIFSKRKFSVDSCNYEITRVFYALFVDLLACYGSHHLLAFLYISAPFYCFHCVFCHFYSVIFFSFQFPPFKLCSMSCSCFLLHVSSIFHRLQSFSALAWVKPCQTPLQNAMKLHAMRVVVWVSFPHCFKAISPIGLCLRVS